MRQEDTLQDARYAPPRAQVEDIEELSGSGPALASRGQRLGAVVIDVVVAVLCMWVAGKLASWDSWGTGGQEASLWRPILLQPLVGFALFCVAHGFLLARRGQTIGKAALGIRITRPDGAQASLARVLGLRYGLGYATTIIPVLGQIFGVVDALMIFRTSRRCLHDVMADTIVVKA